MPMRSWQGVRLVQGRLQSCGALRRLRRSMTMSRATPSPSPSTDGSPSRAITVVDVYELASGIGQDFEKLIDAHGTDSVRELMPKVISSLETLEALAARNERENEEIASLKASLARMETENAERLQNKNKFDRELEHIEDNYRKEIKELWEMVGQLQADNKKLNSSLSSAQEPTSPGYGLREEELGLMRQLKETVEEQRLQLRSVQIEAEERGKEIEALTTQTDKLGRVNKELSRKVKAIQNQGRSLVEEKAELISQLQRSETSLHALEDKLGETERARRDLELTKRSEQRRSPASEDVRLPRMALGAPAKAEESSGENTPRFTLAELREVLQEKNSLKARVMELEEELGTLRPTATPSPAPAAPAPTTPEDEMVVYGPINREPEEKLYPWRFQRRDSGVRKFFSSLWAGSSTSASPRKVPVASPALPR